MLATRRTFLTGSAATAVVAALGVGYGPLPAPEVGRALLSASEGALVAAIADAMFPTGGAFGVGASEIDIVASMDTLLGESLDPEVGVAVRWLLRALEAGTIASRGASFVALPLDDRRAVLATWADNVVLPRRLAHDLLRMAFGMAFYNSAAALRQIGWGTACRGGHA